MHLQCKNIHNINTNSLNKNIPDKKTENNLVDKNLSVIRGL